MILNFQQRSKPISWLLRQSTKYLFKLNDLLVKQENGVTY